MWLRARQRLVVSTDVHRRVHREWPDDMHRRCAHGGDVLEEQRFFVRRLHKLCVPLTFSARGASIVARELRARRVTRAVMEIETYAVRIVLFD